MPTKQKKPKEHYQADYRGATPKQVAQAMLKYRPISDGDHPNGKAEPKKKQAQIRG